MTSRVDFLRVGKIKPFGLDDKSAIHKENVKFSFLSETGFDDDEQANKKYHGGKNKAVLFFSALTYEKINKELKIDLEYDEYSPLGENILVSNIDEDSVCVGDIFAFGDAIVQVTQPREPCNTLSLNTGEKGMLKCVYNKGYTGWYAKVLKEGFVQQWNKIVLKERDYPNLTITTLNNIIRNPKKEKLTSQAIACQVLGKPFKDEILKRL